MNLIHRARRIVLVAIAASTVAIAGGAAGTAHVDAGVAPHPSTGRFGPPRTELTLTAVTTATAPRSPTAKRGVSNGLTNNLLTHKTVDVPKPDVYNVFVAAYNADGFGGWCIVHQVDMT